MTRASDEPHGKASRYEALVILIACLMASAGVVASVWSVPFVPTNDGPQALLLAHIDAHYDDPGSIFPLQLTRGLGLSGRGFMFLYAPLEGIPWPNGVRVAQALMLLGFAWGVAALTRALDRRFTYKSLLGFVLCSSWPFYMGFWAFCVASVVGLWVLAAVVAVHRPSRIAKLAISIGLACELLCHPVMGVVTFVAVALVVLSRHFPVTVTGRKALTSDAIWLLVSGLPHLIVFGVMRGA
ncbi:MAG: hypothetical protein JNK04_22510, partial [Myxococcales bacterium]|nr:hypothetical protein [Myxococcales bacterium]